jgi:hypothetical protein
MPRIDPRLIPDRSTPRDEEKTVISGRKYPIAGIAPGSLFALLCAVGCGDELDSLTPGGEDESFTSIYESDSFQQCSECHAPGAPGRTEGIEETLDFSTRDSAFASLRRTASGLIGNFAACNGVPFLGDTAGASLLVASLDGDVRRAYDNPDFPDCNEDTISDQTNKIDGPLPSQLLQDLKAWVDADAPDR